MGTSMGGLSELGERVLEHAAVTIGLSNQPSWHKDRRDLLMRHAIDQKLAEL